MSEDETIKRKDVASTALEDLLDDALQDFDTQSVSTQTLTSAISNADAKSTATEKSNPKMRPSKKVEFASNDEPKSRSNEFEEESNSDIEFVDKLLSDFQNKMRDILENVTTDEQNPDDRSHGDNKFVKEEVRKKCSKMAQDTMNTLISETLSDDDSNSKRKNFKGVISQAIKNLCNNCKELEGGILTDSSDDIAKLINDLTFKESEELDESEIEAHFGKIFIKIGQTLLYPPLKEICRKYPIYLGNNKTKISKETYTNYEKQYEDMLEICKIFEGTEMNEQKFYDVLTIMQRVQNCGLPPQELIEPENFKMYDGLISGLCGNRDQQCTIF